jgi:hypothetical protein
MKTVYRNRKLLDLAHRVTACQFLLPVCMGISPEGCEPAHSNQGAHGKSIGMKAADDQHVASCPNCHRLYDGQLGYVMPREQANKLFNDARTRTFALYARMGWLEEVGYIHEEPAGVEW